MKAHHPSGETLAELRLKRRRLHTPGAPIQNEVQL
jgi:hypothetical protein